MDAQVELTQHGFASTVTLDAGQTRYVSNMIAVAHDLIFGLSVWTGESWFPLSSADLDELQEVQRLIDNDPKFLHHDKLGKLIEKAKAST